MLSRLSIRARMVVMAVCAAIALAILFAIQFFAGQDVAEATAQSKSLQADLETVSTMQLANSELLLAAMDSIIDKEEGQIQPERKVTIDRAVALIRGNVATVERLAREAGRPDLTTGFAGDFDAVAAAIQVDLAKAILSNAGPESFARLDDVIDGTGERISDTLAALKAVGMEEMTTALNDAERGSQEVTQNIAGVSEGAQETGHAAGQVLTAVQSLASQADALRSRVDAFQQQVRAA